MAILVFHCITLPSNFLLAQQSSAELHRKTLQTVPPSYPVIARTMKLTGTVRVALKVAPSGKVMSAEVLGGHPVLARAAIDAVMHWRYEAGPQETNELAILSFQP